MHINIFLVIAKCRCGAEHLIKAVSVLKEQGVQGHDSSLRSNNKTRKENNVLGVIGTLN